MPPSAACASEQQFDIGIVGGGPAGLSAAIWSARYLHSVVVVDSGDPAELGNAAASTAILGLDGVTPPELRRRGRATCRELGVELIDGIVLHAEQSGDEEFLLSLEGGARVSRSPAAARDRHPRRLAGHSRPRPRVRDATRTCVPTATATMRAARRSSSSATGGAPWAWRSTSRPGRDDIIICTNGRPAELDEPEYCEKLDALNIPVLTDPITQVCCENSAHLTA